MRLILALVSLAGAAWGQPPGGGGGGGGTLGDGIWRRNAAYGEGLTFDTCNGHQPGSGQYHYHATPRCLRAELGDNIVITRSGRTGAVYSEKTSGWTHSPIVAWASDGYPIYGPYGYSDPTSAKSAIKRIKSGFQLRNITTRTTLPTWALPNHSGVSQNLTSSQYGPAVSTTFPLGRYVEDYEWLSGVGDLDQYNGRFTVTPEFPNGTYAYYTTIDDTGAPAFPYLLAGQYYGTVSGGFSGTASSSAVDYFNAGKYTTGPTAPAITSWDTKYSLQYSMVTSGFDPSAGAATTWPGSNVISGATTYGGQSTPSLAETQRVRYTSTSVYVNTNGLPAALGPWFEEDQPGGVFPNFPSASSLLFTIPLAPTAATSLTSVGMGAVGLFVNGATLYGFLDGNSYSNSQGSDPVLTTAGGPITVAPYIAVVSSASYEMGPVAAGSLLTATPIYSSVLATSTAAATSANWPVSLGGSTVSVKDSSGTTRAALISYASPTQVNFQLPTGTAGGDATVTITAGSSSSTSRINVQPVYPNLFMLNTTALAAATLVRVHNGVNTNEQVYSTASDGSIVASAISLNGDQVYLVVYGSGLGSATSATATIGGVSATVAYAGAQGTYSGLDQYNILIPSSLAGKGKVDVVVTAGGKPSNAVNITIQ